MESDLAVGKERAHPFLPFPIVPFQQIFCPLTDQKNTQQKKGQIRICEKS
jgi:hypothetical protein